MNKFKSITLITLLILPLFLRANDAEKAVNELLDVIQWEKMVEDTMNATIQIVRQSNTRMDEDKLSQFYQKYMGPESLRKDVVAMYAEIFTEDEIWDIVTFYKSPTGQKTIKKLPEIALLSVQMGQERIMEHQDELAKILCGDSQEISTEP